LFADGKRRFSGMGDVKYAVVRVQGEQRMIDLFTLLVNNGYSDVSFVSSLAHTILNTETTASQEEASTSRVSSSSAASAAHVSTTTAIVQPQPPPTTPVQQQQGMSTPKQAETPQRDSSVSSPPPANAADLLQSLFDRNAVEDHVAYSAHHQPWVLPTGEIPSSPTSIVRPMIAGMPTGLMPPSGFVGGSAPPEFAGASAVQLVRSMNYNGVDGAGRKMPYIVRMKGWQRKMLRDAMATGRLPTGDELTELCARAQVTETQAIRFFRKRKFTDNNGQTAGGGPYQMDDDDDGMRGDSPEIYQQTPKDELE
ncbi:hypothetical protein PENTCL1PPCAC_18690, partial [Pristionchus entomophagus]